VATVAVKGLMERLTSAHDQLLTWSQASSSSVTMSNRVTAFESFRRNISRTIDRRFQIPSGSRPRSGRSMVCHSVAAGGAELLR